jgi:putative NADPH-quinone reductase
MARIAIIQGHPDPAGNRFGHALAAAYAEGARAAGHTVSLTDIARLEFPLVRTKEDFETGPLPAGILEAQAAIEAAGHLVFFYPLWFGTMPALLKGFFEQVFRPVFVNGELGNFSNLRLKGRTARLVVTMGMPALAYRWMFGRPGWNAFEASMLKLCGIGPVRTTLVGRVDESAAAREKWLANMRDLGRRGA